MRRLHGRVLELPEFPGELIVVIDTSILINFDMNVTRAVYTHEHIHIGIHIRSQLATEFPV